METDLHQDKPATPEDIWAILREISKRQEAFDKRQEAFGQWMEKSGKAADKRKEESDRRQEKIDKQIEEFGKHLKQVDEQFKGQWGKLMESLVEGDLVPLLQQRGIEVLRTYPNASGRRDGEHYEYDILALNGEEVVVVEVKTTLRAEDVKHFLAKLAKFTWWAPEQKGKRIFGAVAYLKTHESVVLHAQRQGLFVIRATGSSASIVNAPDFQPRVFE